MTEQFNFQSAFLRASQSTSAPPRETRSLHRWRRRSNDAPIEWDAIRRRFVADVGAAGTVACGERYVVTYLLRRERRGDLNRTHRFEQ